MIIYAIAVKQQEKERVVVHHGCSQSGTWRCDIEEGFDFLREGPAGASRESSRSTHVKCPYVIMSSSTSSPILCSSCNRGYSQKEETMATNVLLLLLPLTASAFALPSCSSIRQYTYSLLVAPTTTSRVGLTAKIPNDDDKDEANQTGMASAFRDLEALDSLDDDYKSVPKKGASSIKGIDDLEDVKQLKNVKAPPEAEVKLYKDMMNESEKEDVELYVDMMTDMGGTTPKPKKKQTLQIQDEQVELLDSLERSPEDLNVFMNQALQEALKEAKSKTPEELASIDPLDDEDMMDEIRNVFDRANDELLASLEDIRKEQVRFYITVCVTI
jgi:hypothetical protein